MRKKMGLAAVLTALVALVGHGAAGARVGSEPDRMAGTVEEKAIELDMVWVAVATASWSS